MNLKEFHESVQRDKENPPSLGDCPKCNKPIFPAGSKGSSETPGEPRFIKVDGKDVRVHEDCYFDGFGEEIDKHPIHSPGRSPRFDCV